MRLFSSASLLISAGLGLVACDKPTPPVTPIPVRIAVAEALTADSALGYSAQIVPETQVDVAFRTDGYIDEIMNVAGAEGRQRLLQAGDMVSSGDILARVEDQQYRDNAAKAQANLDKAQAALVKGEQDFKRAEALKVTKSITGPDYDSAQQEYSTAVAAVAGARAQLDSANIRLNDTAVRAPLSGLVLQREIELGTLVHSGTVAFVIANTAVVKAVFGVPDVMLNKIALGTPLNIRTASFQNRVFVGEVSEIGPAANERTRIFEISVSIDNADGALRSGMVASLDVDRTMLPAEFTVIPISGIVRSDTDDFAVYTVESASGNSVARLKTVETGEVFGNRIAIISGLSIGDQVIVTGNTQVKDGQIITVVP
jgi:RND family efflux transporter MFP subunit